MSTEQLCNEDNIVPSFQKEILSDFQEIPAGNDRYAVLTKNYATNKIIKTSTIEKIILLSGRTECKDKELISNLISSGRVKGENIVIAGARTWDDYERKFIRSNHITFQLIKRLLFEGIQDYCDALMEFARGKKAHLIVDLSILDQAHYSSSEPGGLSTRELIYLIQRLKLVNNIKSIELVGNNTSILLKLLREFYKHFA